MDLARQDEIGELGQAFNIIMDGIRVQGELVKQKKLDNNALLLNFFPDTVVARIKQGEQQIIDFIPQATVLFARIVGLSQLSATNKNKEVLVIFNKLVNAFDENARKYGVNKQNTIGDYYVAVCGLSSAYLDHVERTVKFALQMLETLDAINQEHELDLGLRIAIHSGSLMAGIVGTQNFAYQIWGETVDIAANLSSKLAANGILITQIVGENLSDQYSIINHNAVEIDGLGELPTWMLVAPSKNSQQLHTVES